MRVSPYEDQQGVKYETHNLEGQKQLYERSADPDGDAKVMIGYEMWPHARMYEELRSVTVATASHSKASIRTLPFDKGLLLDHQVRHIDHN